MAYDEGLAQRIRELLDGEPTGGPSFATLRIGHHPGSAKQAGIPALFRAGLLVLTLTLLGCTPTPEPPRAPLDAPIFVAATGDTIRMTESLRIGVLDGDEAYQFTYITWLLPLADGGVILYDAGAKLEGSLIRQYDDNGRLVRAIGGEGAGPGEYSPGPGGTLLADGSLLITDQQQARITRFDTAGELLQTVRGPTGMVDRFPATDGGWFVAAVTRNPPNKPRWITYFRYSQDGTLVDSIPASPRYHDGPWSGPNEARAMTIILPDGRQVSSSTDTIGFTIESATDTLAFGHASDRARFTEAETAALNATYAARARQRGQQVETVAFPEFKQAYFYLASDPAGRILFLRRSEATLLVDTIGLRPDESPYRATNDIDLFDSSGTYRGRLLVPHSVARLGFAFGVDHLWLVHTGADGEQYAVRWLPDRVAW